jgi:hypothetical protein
MNVKSCLKVDSGLLFRTASLKLEGARLYINQVGAVRRICCAAVVARRVLRVRTDWVVP